jgi:6-phosphofructokinase 2
LVRYLNNELYLQFIDKKPMQKIVTLTLNPSVDTSTNFSGLVAEQKLRCQNPRFDAGGGGINVSKAIKKLGGNSTALFLAGGLTGTHFTNLVEELKLDFEKVAISGETRQNFTCLDESSNAQYRFTFTGPTISENEAQALLDKIESHNPKYIVASGSLPTGIASNFYAKVAQIANKLGSRFVLDTSNDELRQAMNEGIYLMKPNISELAKLVGVENLALNEVDDAAKSIIAKGSCQIVVVSLGPQGAIYTTKEKCEHVPAPVVNKKSTVGAGDSMVGGMTFALQNGESVLDAVKLGIACGTAATMNEGTQLFREADVKKLLRWLNVYGEKYSIKLN